MGRGDRVGAAAGYTPPCSSMLARRNYYIGQSARARCATARGGVYPASAPRLDSEGFPPGGKWPTPLDSRGGWMSLRAASRLCGGACGTSVTRFALTSNSGIRAFALILFSERYSWMRSCGAERKFGTCIRTGLPRRLRLLAMTPGGAKLGGALSPLHGGEQQRDPPTAGNRILPKCPPAATL